MNGLLKINKLRLLKRGYQQHLITLRSFSSSSDDNDDKSINITRTHTKPRTRTRSSSRRTPTWLDTSSSTSSSSSKKQQIPSLKEFLHRQTVIHQYRSFLKTIKLFTNQKDYDEALKEVKNCFKMNCKEEDKVAIRMLVTDGQRRLAQIQSLVGYKPPPSSSTSSSTSLQPEHDSDSWLNIQDDLDKRGRVGLQWPWERTEEKEKEKEEDDDDATTKEK